MLAALYLYTETILNTNVGLECCFNMAAIILFSLEKAQLWLVFLYLDIVHMKGKSEKCVVCLCNVRIQTVDPVGAKELKSSR